LLARHAAMVIASLDAFQDDLTALEGAITGTIRVAACESVGRFVLPDAIAELALDRSQAQIDVIVERSGEVLRAVRSREVHMGIAAPHRPMPGLESVPLLRDRIVWLAPPGGSLPRVLDAKRMRGLTVLVMSRESSLSTMTLTALESAGYRPARLLRFDSLETIKRAVGAGVGVTALSRLAVAPELAAGQLREIRMDGLEPLERTFEIFTPEQRSPTALERMFHDILRVHCVAISTRSEM
jgi:DNA-binding transcriptional LysR family regulator